MFPQHPSVSRRSESPRGQLRRLLALPALGVIVLAMLACAASSSATSTTKATATGTSATGNPNSTLPPGAPTSPPNPAAAPTNTPVPPPANIAGQYTGTYTVNGSAVQSQMDLKITQSNSTLSGTTNESGSVAADSGAMGGGGNFTLLETFSGGHTATLQGHTVIHGLAGTWSSTAGSGTWSLGRVADVSGNYDGSYTSYGSTTTYPMGLSLTQVGGVLAGTTTEGSFTANDVGTIATSGAIAITETFTSDGHHAYLNSSVGNGVHLEGTWNVGGSALGTWAVNQY